MNTGNNNTFNYFVSFFKLLIPHEYFIVSPLRQLPLTPSFAGPPPPWRTSVGARVMRDPDGRPAQRDPVFLAETQIVKKPLADRAMAFKDEVRARA